MSLARALDAEREKLSHCVHCGFCLPVCPTYTRLGDEADSPRGRLYLMQAVVEGRIGPDSDAFQTHLDRCLGCRACEPVCPSGVEYGALLERARAVAVEARPPSWLERMVLGVMGRGWLERPLLAGARTLRATGLPAAALRLLPRTGLLGRLRTALAMLAASTPVRLPSGAPDRGGRGDPSSTGAGAPGLDPTPERSAFPPGARATRSRVGVLTGCVQEGLFSRVNRATARVLQANGFEVVPVAGQGCCGALHAHGGRLERARGLARRNVAAFEAAGVDRVAVNAAGCGAAMKEYGELLDDDPDWRERARALASRVEDVSEILAEAGPRSGASLPVRATYDAPCHLLHAQGTEAAPFEVLAAIPGLEVVPLRNAAECCGGAGTYGLTHPDLGGRIGADKVEAIRESGAPYVVTGNPGCILQIGAALRSEGLDVDVLHPVELLDESYRRAGLYDRGPGREPSGGRDPREGREPRERRDPHGGRRPPGGRR